MINNYLQQTFQSFTEDTDYENEIDRGSILDLAGKGWLIKGHLGGIIDQGMKVYYNFQIITFIK